MARKRTVGADEAPKKSVPLARDRVEKSRERLPPGIILPAIFDRPNFIASSDWIEHIPFAFWLVAAQIPEVVVELGSQTGVSFFAFCQGAEKAAAGTRCFGISTGLPPSNEKKGSPYKALRDHAGANYPESATILTEGSEKALGQFADGSIDLLHIDGSHSSGMPFEGMQAWIPKLSKRGLLLLHGAFAQDRRSAVVDLYEKLRETHSAFEFQHGKGLVLFSMGRNKIEPLQDLFAAWRSDNERGPVQAMFASLGKGIADAHAVAERETADAQRKVQAEGLAGEREAARSKLARAETTAHEEAKKSARLELELSALRHEMQARTDKTSQDAHEAALSDEAVGERDALATDIAARAAKAAGVAQRIAELQEEAARHATTLETANREHAETKAAFATQRDELLANAHKANAEARAIVDERQAEIAKMRADLAEREWLATELTSEVSRQALTIRRLEQAGFETETWLNAARRTAEEAQKALTEKDRALASAMSDLSTANLALVEREGALGQTKKQFQADTERTNTLIAQREAALAEAIRDRDVQAWLLGERDHALRELEAVRQKVADQLQAETERNRGLTGKLDEMDRALTARRQIADQLQAEQERSQGFLARVEALDRALSGARARAEADAVQVAEGELKVKTLEAEAERAGVLIAERETSLVETGRERDHLADLLAERDAVVARLREELETSNAMAVERDELMDSMRDDLERQAEIIEGMETVADQHLRDLVTRDTLLEQSLQTISALQGKVTEAARLAQSMQRTEAELALQREAFERLEEEMERGSTEREQLITERLTLRDRISFLESALEQRRHEAEQTAAELMAAREEVRLAGVMRNERESLIASYKEHVTALVEERSVRREEVAELSATNRNLAAERDRTANALQGAAQRQADLESDLEDFETRYHSLEYDLNTARHDLAEARAQSSTVDNGAMADAERLKEEHAKLEARIQDYADKVVRLTRLIAEKDQDIRRGTDAVAKLEQKMAKSAGPLSREADAARFAEERAETVRQAAAQQLGDTIAALLEIKRFPFETARSRLRRQAAMLRRSGLFDERWYLDRYKDVEAAGVDPFRHYVEHGAKEGREPNPRLAAAKGEVMPRSNRPKT